mmetsp:Transcript_18349/g.51426  ORF Transcript_18349/g.51426 Transcript_18349/m.51426 type:complete len:563 (-) Transcript_18349:62-1750(-)
MAALTEAADGTKSPDPVNSQSTTATTTINGQHEHTIVGYSLIKGIGDGEPIASERFTVGGHEWVLLFYPDGKRSSSSEGHLPPPPQPRQHGAPHAMPHPQGGGPGPAPPGMPPGANAPMPAHGIPQLPGPDGGEAPEGMYGNMQMGMGPQAPIQGQHPVHIANMAPRPAREATNDYAALFVALIGEGPNPQGVVNTSEGKVVRAFHRFTLVDQNPKDGEQPKHLTKGRRRDQGAVKISCARQDPNARNCHGYRKFVKRSMLENPDNGYLKDDTIIIRYAIELVVSSGGALSRNSHSLSSSGPAVSGSAITVPPPALGKDMADLLEQGEGADVVFKVEDEVFRGHRIVLTARSPVFRALLSSGMREAEKGEVSIQDVRPAVFKALLHFVYADSLPDEHEGPNLDVHMAQHLLVAADQFQLSRLRAICEQRLCETVDEASVATTLTLAEQNHAGELKRVCLEFMSSSEKLDSVMSSEGFQHMLASCPHLQVEILQNIANRRRQPASGSGHGGHHHGGHLHRAAILEGGSGRPPNRGHVRVRDMPDGIGLLEDGGGPRRVRPRRE